MFNTESKIMRWARQTGFERLAWSLRRLHCPVDSNALVLEVGSGGNPYPRSNVLLDAYETTRERHWVPLRIDRPMVLGYVENLPFRDGAFDFVIASHVLEHSSNPERFLSELQRVARAGYIEVPDAFMERINPYRDHRLEVTIRDMRLVIRKKSAWQSNPEIVELYEHHAKALIAHKLIPANPFAFHVRYYWESQIAFSVVNPEVDADWAVPKDHEQAPAASSTPGWRGTLMNVLRTTLSQSRRNKNIELAGLLSCPNCRGSIRVENPSSIDCENCHSKFPLKNGVPAMYAMNSGR